MTLDEINAADSQAQTHDPQQTRDSDKLSRRDFISGAAAAGLALGVAQAAPAAAPPPQQAPRIKPENALTQEPQQMFRGTPSAAVLEQLRAAGVKILFHTNTSGFGPFWEAIYKAGDVQVINVTHEGSAVAAAAGYAMASKKMGFFFGSGVGVFNSLSNTYCAWKDRVPVLVTFGGGSIADQGMDSFESWDDHLGPMRQVTNWTGTLLSQDITTHLRRAMKFAFGPPSGPVALDWSAGGGEVEVPIYKIDLANMRLKSRAQSDLIEKTAQWLIEARYPIFVVGSQVGVEGAEAEMLALAEKLAVPVGETTHSLYSNFPNDHPLFLGEMQSQRLPRKEDLLISFGESFTAGNHDERSLRSSGPRRVVHISHDPDTMGRSFVPDLSIVSEIRTAIRDLSDAIDAMLTKDRIAKIRQDRFAQISAFTAQLKQSRELALRHSFDASPISLERLGFELEKALDKDAVIVPEIGTQNYKLFRQLSFGGQNKKRIGRTKGSALGWGVGAAFGVNLGYPDRQVVALEGVGGFLFNQSEALWSIARYEAPLLIVIVNNHSYNESRGRNNQPGSLLSDLGIDFNGYLGAPDVEYTKIAEAYGLRGEKVLHPGELPGALQRCLRHMRDGKAVILDVNIAPDGIAMPKFDWYQKYSLADIRKKKLNA